MVGKVEEWEVEEDFGTDVRALTALAGSVLLGSQRGRACALKCDEIDRRWQRQFLPSMGFALAYLIVAYACQHLYWALCLQSAAVPSASCSFLLLIHSQCYPAALWKGGNRSMLVRFSGAATHWHGEGENAALAVQ